jgi:hypothetical protein
MKKINWLIVLGVLFISAGCFDTVEEISMDDKGGGVFVSTADMSSLMGMIKAFAGDKLKNDSLTDDKKMKMDTLINLKDMKDSLGNLNADEKKLLEKATLKINMDIEGEKFTITFTFPYSRPADIVTIGGILKKTKNKLFTKQLDKMNPEGKDNPTREMIGLDEEGNSFEVSDYFIQSYKYGYLSKKLNREMYAHVNSDSSLNGLKQMSQMGFNSSLKTIINLPKPAKKVGGRGVKLSDDRKKITIEGTIDDFFEDASLFEYEIEY